MGQRALEQCDIPGLVAELVGDEPGHAFIHRGSPLYPLPMRLPRSAVNHVHGLA